MLRFVNKLLNERPLIVSGFFGVGKTRLTSRSVLYIDERIGYDREWRRRYGRLVFVLAYPLRRLRHQVYERYFKGRAFEFRAHDEVCPALKKRLEERGVLIEEEGEEERQRYYLVTVAEHLKAVKEGVEDCDFAKQVDALRKYYANGGRMVVTTHMLGLTAGVLAYTVRRRPVLIYDEAEDFMLMLSRGIHESIIKAIEAIDEKLAKRLTKIMKKHTEMYFIRKSVLEDLFRDIVLVSATFPSSLRDAIFLLTGKEPETHLLHNTDDITQDVAIFYRGYLSTEEMDEWWPIVSPQVAELVRIGVQRYGVVGIVAKRHSLADRIISVLSNMGFRIVHDKMRREEFNSLLPEAQVVVLTTRGKLYRGVNILPKGVDDVPFIIAFYQGAKDAEFHPEISNVMTDINDELLETYVREMVYAKNLQAVYRFNRKSGRRHVMVFFDWRFHQAYYHFYRNYLYYYLVRVEVDDLSKVADVARQYI